MFTSNLQQIALFCLIITALACNISLNAQPAARFAAFNEAEPLSVSDSTMIESIRCKMVVPAGHYILAESFFANFDNVVRRMAFLERHGFKQVTFIHTTCQEFDVDKELYAVIIHGPVSNKTELYPEMFKAQEKAAEEQIRLITTRIIHCRQ
jgi:hypothetical protein